MAQDRLVQGNHASEIYWHSLNQKQVDKGLIFRGFWQGHSPKAIKGVGGEESNQKNLSHSEGIDPVID